MDADDFDAEAFLEITVKPKHLDVEVPVFKCVACLKDVTPTIWAWKPQDIGSPPLCRWCANHWGCRGRPVGVTRGDYRALIRLNAMVNRLDWEVRNGRRSK